jgi:ubiquitin C-terminal hydrolase
MATLYWNYEKSRDDSYIYDALCGQTYNNIHCINCGHESECFENFLDISIPMAPNARSVDDLLQDFFEP